MKTEPLEAVGPRPPKTQVPGEKQNVHLVPSHTALTQSRGDFRLGHPSQPTREPKTPTRKERESLCVDTEPEFDDR